MSDRLNQLLGLLRESSQDSFILFALAKEYEQLQQFNEARRYYQELFSLNPDYIGLYYHWGKLLEDLNEAEQALDIYEQGIGIALKQKDEHSERELRAAKYNCELLR
jgi:tetratricopeptide (TPR) repeat protein